LAARLRPISSPVSRVDEAVNRLRDYIEKGSLPAGERLPSEKELVEQLQISRNVLREAIGRLETMGLVVVRRGLGTFVGDRNTLSMTTKLIRSALAVSPRDVAKVAELRGAIECEAARRAAVLATDADFAALEQLYTAMQSSQDHVESMRRDLDFHLKIIEIADNPLMRNVVEVLEEFIYVSMIQTLPASRREKLPGDLNRDILTGLRTRNPDLAEKAMRQHMDSIARRLKDAESAGPAALKSDIAKNLPPKL